VTYRPGTHSLPLPHLCRPGYENYTPSSFGAVYFAGLYVCLLGGALLLSILIFAARSLLDLSEEADLSRGAWHRLSGGGGAAVGVPAKF